MTSVIEPRRVGRTVGLILMVMLLGTGCVQKVDHGVALHPAKGKVEIAGKPEAGVQVRLHPVGKLDDMDAPRPFAETGADGGFALGTFEAEDGAPAGEYLVTIFWPGKEQGPSGAPDQLAGKYTNILKPSFRVTIRDGDNRLEPFKLDLPGPKPSGGKAATPSADPNVPG